MKKVTAALKRSDLWLTSVLKGMRRGNQSFQQCDTCNDKRGTTNYGCQQVINALLWEEMINTITLLGNKAQRPNLQFPASSGPGLISSAAC